MPAEVAACFLDEGLYNLSGKIFYDRKLAWNAWRTLAEVARNGTHDRSGEQANQISEVEYEKLVGGINF